MRFSQTYRIAPPFRVLVTVMARPLTTIRRGSGARGRGSKGLAAGALAIAVAALLAMPPAAGAQPASAHPASPHPASAHPASAAAGVTRTRAAALLAIAPPLSTPSSHVGPDVTTANPATVLGPLLWTAPLGVDINPIDGLTCPSSTLCVAVDRAGGVLWSTDPTGGAQAWHVTNIDSTREMTGVSCPSTGLCVAVDAAGNVFSSTDPASGNWSLSKVDTNGGQQNTDTGGSVLLRGISCPSTALCVAIDSVGDALVSTNPTGGAGAWAAIHADTALTAGCTGSGLSCQPPLVGIACPSTSLCEAVDFSGNLVSTTTPTAAAPWASTSTTSGGLGSLWGISCPTATTCLAVDGPGQRVMTFDPYVPGTMAVRTLPEALDGIWCAPTLCLISAETGSGVSGLVGSTNPTAKHPTWSLGSLGGVNAVSCLTASLCVAADDEGNVAVGDTTLAMGATFSGELLSKQRLRSRAALARTGVDPLTFTSPIDGQVTLAWTKPTASGGVTLASATHVFTRPGTTVLRLQLTDAGRRLLGGKARQVRLTATATFLAGNGTFSRSRALTFVRPPPKARRRR